MGLEGLVSKHKERPYRAGRCDHWIKVKNRRHPAYWRVMDPVLSCLLFYLAAARPTGTFTPIRTIDLRLIPLTIVA
jgi:hypothetical protein